MVCVFFLSSLCWQHLRMGKSIWTWWYRTLVPVLARLVVCLWVRSQSRQWALDQPGLHSETMSWKRIEKFTGKTGNLNSFLFPCFAILRSSHTGQDSLSPLCCLWVAADTYELFTFLGLSLSQSAHFHVLLALTIALVRPSGRAELVY